jgi:hypothetical protein
MLHQSILARTQQLKSTVQSKICNRGCDKPALDSGEHSTQNSVKSLNIVRGLTYNRTLIPYDCMHNYVTIFYISKQTQTDFQSKNSYSMQSPIYT